jgi:hypothetical protein
LNHLLLLLHLHLHFHIHQFNQSWFHSTADPLMFLSFVIWMYQESAIGFRFKNSFMRSESFEFWECRCCFRDVLFEESDFWHSVHKNLANRHVFCSTFPKFRLIEAIERSFQFSNLPLTEWFLIELFRKSTTHNRGKDGIFKWYLEWHVGSEMKSFEPWMTRGLHSVPSLTCDLRSGINIDWKWFPIHGHQSLSERRTLWFSCDDKSANGVKESIKRKIQWRDLVELTRKWLREGQDNGMFGWKIEKNIHIRRRWAGLEGRIVEWVTAKQCIS